MLDFCGAHNITADVEVIPVEKINGAYEGILRSDVKYRLSIDMKSLGQGSAAGLAARPFDSYLFLR